MLAATTFTTISWDKLKGRHFSRVCSAILPISIPSMQCLSYSRRCMLDVLHSHMWDGLCKCSFSTAYRTRPLTYTAAHQLQSAAKCQDRPSTLTCELSLAQRASSFFCKFSTHLSVEQNSTSLPVQPTAVWEWGSLGNGRYHHKSDSASASLFELTNPHPGLFPGSDIMIRTPCVLLSVFCEMIQLQRPASSHHIEPLAFMLICSSSSKFCEQWVRLSEELPAHPKV